MFENDFDCGDILYLNTKCQNVRTEDCQTKHTSLTYYSLHAGWALTLFTKETVQKTFAMSSTTKLWRQYAYLWFVESFQSNENEGVKVLIVVTKYEWIIESWWVLVICQAMLSEAECTVEEFVWYRICFFADLINVLFMSVLKTYYFDCIFQQQIIFNTTSLEDLGAATCKLVNKSPKSFRSPL